MIVDINTRKLPSQYGEVSVMNSLRIFTRHSSIVAHLVCLFCVSVAVTFHLMFVYIICSSVYVTEWPSFGKQLLLFVF